MLTARALMTLLRAMMGVAANLLLAVLLHWRETESLYQENNLLENLQLAALAGCVLVYGLRARRGVDGYARLQLGALAVLSACMFYRESDFHWLLPEGTRAYAIAYVIHRGAFVLALLGVAGAFTRCWLLDRRRFLDFLDSGPGVLLVLATVLLAGGVLLDKSVVSIAEPNRLFEELFELNAYGLMLIAGGSRALGRPPAGRAPGSSGAPVAGPTRTVPLDR